MNDVNEEKQPDPEIVALEKICPVFDTVADPITRGRMLQYLVDRYFEPPNGAAIVPRQRPRK